MASLMSGTGFRLDNVYLVLGDWCKTFNVFLYKVLISLLKNEIRIAMEIS